MTFGTFECSECEHVLKEMISTDPMKFDKAGWFGRRIKSTRMRNAFEKSAPWTKEDLDRRDEHAPRPHYAAHGAQIHVFAMGEGGPAAELHVLESKDVAARQGDGG